jgi:N-acetylmuramoyl-L-alanine amidase
MRSCANGLRAALVLTAPLAATGAVSALGIEAPHQIVRAHETVSSVVLTALPPYGTAPTLATDTSRLVVLHLLSLIGSEYYSNSSVEQPADPPAWLDWAPPAQGPRPSSPAPPPRADSMPKPIGLTAIRRNVMPDRLRITLSLNGETAVVQERLEGPPRVFVDLHDTMPGALAGREISFDDDVVRTIRVATHENQHTRVVLDLDGAARHSVFILSNPHRVVIDVEREPSATVRVVPRPAPFPISRDNSPELPKEAVLVPATAPVTPDRLADGLDLPVVPPTVEAAMPPELALVEIPDATTSTEPTHPASDNLEGGFSLSRQLGLGVSRIVIDPGHGGRDPGSLGRGIVESELVLDVALRLEALLSAQPGIEVVLTRRSDTLVPLEERTAIANREQADLFLSIHANASLNPLARGVGTFYLNFAREPEAEALAARENAGSNRTMRSLPDIVQAIALNNKIDESQDFATIVNRALHERLSIVDRLVEDRGVKQAPFFVLIGATMPSVLAEISFLTNEQEATLLRTDGYRQRIAEALMNGVLDYRTSLNIGVVAAQ